MMDRVINHDSDSSKSMHLETFNYKYLSLFDIARHTQESVVPSVNTTSEKHELIHPSI